jgi:prolipoprotein diacylglyceryl transferase
MHPVWNVDPQIFRLGRFSLRWYGLFFALGFFLGYKIMAQFYRREGRNLADLSDLLLYLILGTIIGARLGHVVFYQPGYYLAHPWEIFMIWQGGLASHGGFAGVMVSLYLYVRRHRDLTFIELADRLTIPCLLAASLIRIGNFFNSEILGTPSNVPWTIVFARVDNILGTLQCSMRQPLTLLFFAFCTSPIGRPQSFNFRGESSARG